MTPRALPDRLVRVAPPRCVGRPVDMVDGYKPLEERTRPTFPRRELTAGVNCGVGVVGGVRCVGSVEGVGFVEGVGCIGGVDHGPRLRDGALRERLDAAKRAKLAPSPPFLTASRTARVDGRVPRPVAQHARPEGLQPAAPPPDVERPARERAGSELASEAESRLAVRFL